MAIHGHPLVPYWNSIRRVHAAMGLVFFLSASAMSIDGDRNAAAMPLVRRLVVTVPEYPHAAPVRILLLSDLHVQGPNTTPSRIMRIVEQINRLHPDIIVCAGDFTGDSWFGRHYSLATAIGPLRNLRARLGVFAILGNNDGEVSEIVEDLKSAGVHVLMNDATQAGPIVLGGLDGRLGHSPIALRTARQKTYRDMERLNGVKVLLAHRPDEFSAAPSFIRLVLAGHTHCGQVVLPLVGPLATASDYDRRYDCGVFRQRSKLLVVTAGVGTSHLPLRIGTYPDMWLISIEAKQATRI
jgi:predicted MPP superfamily phosphohydrolase